MEIYANVIQGSLRAISNGGNGFRGQDGGRGVDAADSTARVCPPQSTTIIIIWGEHLPKCMSADIIFREWSWKNGDLVGTDNVH